MPKVKAFLALSSPEKIFFIKALRLQIYLRILLSTRPFKRVVQKAIKLKKDHLQCPPLTHISKRKACELIQKAAHATPFSTCLSRSLAGEAALAMQSIESTITIGVLKQKDHPFTAHAWLICEGELITGFLPNLKDFTPLPSPFKENVH